MTSSLRDCTGIHRCPTNQLCNPHRLAHRACALQNRPWRKLRCFQTSDRKRCCRTHTAAESVAGSVTAAPTYSPHQKGVPQSKVWELDFCSRPMLDERGKKRWELLVCSPDRDFEYSAYFPNNKINSTQVGFCLWCTLSKHACKRCSGIKFSLQLKEALSGLLQQADAEAPKQCRFFRGQMQTIISRSLQDLDIAPVPSRRCFALISKPNPCSVACQHTCLALHLMRAASHSELHISSLSCSFTWILSG